MTDTTSQQPPTGTEDQQKKEALAAFTATLHSVGTNLEAPLRDRATTITANEAALQRQETELAETTARLAKQNAQLAGLADEARDGLKEIGDVQNWAEMIERDLLVLEDMMDDVEKKDAEREELERDHGENGFAHGGENGDVAMNGNDSSNGKKDTTSRGWLRWW
ncbi:GCN5-like 1 [Penicillium argentinense]|uniref:Biogenesis of lysosome-related organelles complex 1 subunit 1 n=1 Tax=Penicillium argentinense TaxID=1131581 RepID=A0A9W9EX90_9EURO|nr:GCN5-like 1 [Penicillium argentinense]KAJ5089718.1 GCN5-like 1 [Penicillium argentinense]